MKKKELNKYFPWPKYFSQTQRACCHTYFKYFTNVSEAGRTCWHTYFKAGCWTPFHCLPFDWTQLSKRCLSITFNQPRYHDWNTPAKFGQKSVSHFDRTIYDILHPIPSPPIQNKSGNTEKRGVLNCIFAVKSLLDILPISSSAWSGPNTEPKHYRRRCTYIHIFTEMQLTIWHAGFSKVFMLPAEIAR